MGGGWYDRAMSDDAPTTGTGFTQAAAAALVQRGLHQDLDPHRHTHMTTDAVTPVVIAIDVTGSMGSWTKIVYDKMPMFFGQLKIQEYAEDPAFGFCAIGDVEHDRAPLQISPFGRGSEIDTIISKVYLEGGGGGNGKESYELPGIFFASDRVQFPNVKGKPFMFITGDEAVYEHSKMEWITKTMGDIHIPELKFHEDKGKHHHKSLDTHDIFQALMRKFHVFHLKKPYSDGDKDILVQWKKLVGPGRILMLQNPKACVDIMLGAIALVTGSRSLDEYIEDLVERGQDAERQQEVRASLSVLLTHGIVTAATAHAADPPAADADVAAAASS